MKFATLFTGCGGADAGLRDSGLTHAWGIELNPDYAAIARANGFDVTVGDVRTTDWAKLEHPNWLHASPPCQRASVANPNAGETQLDNELAIAVVNAVQTLRPEFFSLENVRGYRHFAAYRYIREALVRAGYSIADAVLDAAFYGVPQNRHRLWLIASRVQPAMLPQPTHGNNPEQLGLFGALKPFVGWEKAIAHLPEPAIKDLTPRQIKMAPASADETLLCTAWTQERLGKVITREEHEPSPTILSGWNRPGCLPKILDPSTGTKRGKVLEIEHIAALQSFPHNYIWPQSTRSERARCFEAIGNAVPPLMMQAIAQSNAISAAFAA